MNWQFVLTAQPDVGKPIIISDGYGWCKATLMSNGTWIKDPSVGPLYWCSLVMPPKAAYQDADGSTIIPLSGGLAWDIQMVVMAGDQLWTEENNDLCTTKRPYLTFQTIQNNAVMFKHMGNGHLFITDWNWTRTTLRVLGWDSCYLRRPNKFT